MKIDNSNARRVLATNPVVVITTVDRELQANAITVAWCTPISRQPPLLVASVGKERYSLQNLRETGKEKGFVLNVPHKNQLEATYYVGTRSGSEVEDKIDKSSFTMEEAEKAAAPKLKQCAAWIECRMYDALLEGDHYLIVGQPISVEVPDEYWQGKFLAAKAEVLHHLGGNEFVCNGEVLAAEMKD